MQYGCKGFFRLNNHQVIKNITILVLLVLTCLVALLTTGMTGVVCVAILYLRTLSGKVMFGLEMNDCTRTVGTLAKKKQGAGSLFRDASQRS